MSGIRASRRHCPFPELSPHRATKPAGWCHFENLSTWLTLFNPTWRSPQSPLHPLDGPTQPAFTYEWLVLIYASQLPKSYQTSNSWLQLTPGQALAAARLASQLDFTWGSPSPAQVAAFSDCFIAQEGCPGKTQVGADLGLHHPGNPRASTPSGQLQTSENHHPAPAQLVLHRGGRLGVSGHRQSLQLTVWVNPSHWLANSNQGSTIRGGYTQHT